MGLELINKEDLDAMNQKLDFILNYIKASEIKKNLEETKKDWISLKEWMVLYGKSRTNWYEKYKDIIKHSVDGKLLIYKPSMDKYLADKAIN